MAYGVFAASQLEVASPKGLMEAPSILPHSAAHRNHMLGFRAATRGRFSLQAKRTDRSETENLSSAIPLSHPLVCA
jgi:hypothetical protein